MTWVPIPDSEVTRGLAAMIVFNGLNDYADCRLCRQVPDAARVPVGAIAALAELAMRPIYTNKKAHDEYTQYAQAVLAWLEEMKGEATDVE